MSSRSPTTLTRPTPTTWQITLTSPPDNRLTPSFLSSLAENLDTIEAQWRSSSGTRDDQGPMSNPKSWGENKGAGAVILTGEGKFWSNGLDYESATKNPRFFPDIYDPVIYRLLTFPLVTIGAINGHAFAGGMILALCCDYRIMTSGKGMMCMNELAFGSPLPHSFSAILKHRIPNPLHLRDTLLAHRWTQAELLNASIIDEVVEPEKLLDRATEVGLREGVKVGSGAWGALKDGILHDVIDASRSGRPPAFPKQEAQVFWKRVGGRDASRAKL